LIAGSLFEDNYVNGYGGAIYSVSSVSAYSGQINLTIESCVFKRNSAMQGGAVYAGATFNVINNSTFDGNFADVGADIYTGQFEGSKLLMSGCTFSGERLSYESGIYCDSGQLVISESLLHNLSPVYILLFFTSASTNNTVKLDQDADYIQGSPDCSVVITRTIIENNTSPLGSTIRSLSIDQCIVRQNSLLLVTFQKKLVITNSLIQDAYITATKGSAQVINSTISNSRFLLNDFESHGSTFTSSILSALGKSIVNSSQLISCQQYWYGLKGSTSNSVVNNSSIVVSDGTMTFSNSQIYPMKVH